MSTQGLPYVFMGTTESGTIRSVSGILRNSAGDVLLAQRGHAPAMGLWSLPGGTVESGESDEGALLREFREETGLHITVGKLALTTHKPASGRLYEINTYECALLGGLARPGDDAVALRWVDSVTFHTLDAEGWLTDGLGAALREHGLLPP